MNPEITLAIRNLTGIDRDKRLSRRCAAPGCMNLVPRRPGERQGQYDRRQCCSPRCTKLLLSKRMHDRFIGERKEHPPCIICGNPTEQGPTETYNHYMARKTCSRACGDKYRVQQREDANHSHDWRDEDTKPAPENDGIGSFAKHNLPLRSQVTKYDRPATYVEAESRSLW